MNKFLGLLLLNDPVLSTLMVHGKYHTNLCFATNISYNNTNILALYCNICVWATQAWHGIYKLMSLTLNLSFFESFSIFLWLFWILDIYLYLFAWMGKFRICTFVFFSINQVNIGCFVCYRLFNYGIGIHLIEAPHPSVLPKKSDINPKDNHISFQVRPSTSCFVCIHIYLSIYIYYCWDSL
mgnify:CR=1 FL=1